MKKVIMPLTVGLLVGFLVLIDHVLAPFLYPEGVFIWVAFASWTVFFGASLKERFAVLPSYIVGFLSSNLIIWLSGCFGIENVLISAGVATLINGLIMCLADVKWLTIAGIFTGIFITFSGAGVSMPAWSWNMALLIVIYGIQGLVCGYICMKAKEKYLQD